MYISFICSVNTLANSFAIFFASSGFSFFTVIFKNCVLSICVASILFCNFDAEMFNPKFSIVFCITFVLFAMLLYVDIRLEFILKSVCVNSLSTLFSSATNNIVTDDLYSGFL